KGAWSTVPYPAFAAGHGIPVASQRMVGERLIVPPETEFTDTIAAPDGFLGRFWFADRIWVIDYPKAQLSVLPLGSRALPAGPHQVRLGFAQNVFRKRSTQFPLIPVIVGGDTIDMLFDTGATISLTSAARTALGLTEPTMGGGFIAQSV